MRLIAIFLFAMGFFVGLPIVTTAQSNGTVPPTMALVITGEQVGSSETQDVAYADLDNDGDIDAFVMEWDHSEIWFNQGDGSYTIGEQRFGDAYQNKVVLGDIDKDGDIDAFIAKQRGPFDKPNEVWLNNGSGIFNDSGQRLTGDGYSEYVNVKLADFDKDDDLDALVVASGPYCGTSRLWLNSGDGTYADSGQKWTGCGRTVGIGDLNQDEQLDIIFSATGASTGLTIWSNLGSNVFTQTQITNDTYYANTLSVGDLDKDGDLDLFGTTLSYWYNPIRYNKVWFNDGAGRFSDSGQLFSPLPLKSNLSFWDDEVMLADVDKDGDLDGITISRFARDDTNWPKVTNVVVVRFNDGSGHFDQSISTEIDPAAPASIDSRRLALLPLSERLYLPFIQNGQ